MRTPFGRCSTEIVPTKPPRPAGVVSPWALAGESRPRYVQDIAVLSRPASQTGSTLGNNFAVRGGLRGRPPCALLRPQIDPDALVDEPEDVGLLVVGIGFDHADLRHLAEKFAQCASVVGLRPTFAQREPHPSHRRHEPQKRSWRGQDQPPAWTASFCNGFVTTPILARLTPSGPFPHRYKARNLFDQGRIQEPLAPSPVPTKDAACASMTDEGTMSVVAAGATAAPPRPASIATGLLSSDRDTTDRDMPAAKSPRPATTTHAATAARTREKRPVLHTVVARGLGAAGQSTVASEAFLAFGYSLANRDIQYIIATLLAGSRPKELLQAVTRTFPFEEFYLRADLLRPRPHRCDAGHTSG